MLADPGEARDQLAQSLQQVGVIVVAANDPKELIGRALMFLVMEVKDGFLVRTDEYHDRAKVEAFMRLVGGRPSTTGSDVHHLANHGR